MALDKMHSGYTVLECAPLEPRPSAMREGRVAESGAMSQQKLGPMPHRHLPRFPQECVVQALEHSANGHVQIIVDTGINRSEDHADR